MVEISKNNNLSLSNFLHRKMLTTKYCNFFVLRKKPWFFTKKKLLFFQSFSSLWNNENLVFMYLQRSSFKFKCSCHQTGIRIPYFFDNGNCSRNFKLFQFVFFSVLNQLPKYSSSQIFVRTLRFEIEASFIKFFS